MRQTKRKELSPGASMACGAVAGLLAATATFPLEVSIFLAAHLSKPMVQRERANASKRCKAGTKMLTGWHARVCRWFAAG